LSPALRVPRAAVNVSSAAVPVVVCTAEVKV
jgi:hypothetical protein